MRLRRPATFSDREWAEARTDMMRVLVEVAAAGQTITYSELAARVFDPLTSPRSPALHELLREVCTIEDGRTGLMLGSVVVRRDTGLPGAGYYRFAADVLGRDVSDGEAFWRAEVERVWKHYGGSA